MQQPFLSIVTISLNQHRYLGVAVESVLSQKASDIEYIIVDPGSTDGSRELLASYGAAIDHLVLEPDAGPADGLNKGFARARGRYGYFLNSDDFFLPGAIDRLRRLWLEHSKADALLCGAWMVDVDGQPMREMKPTAISLSALVNNRAVIVQQGFSFCMNRFRQVGGFNPGNRISWDYELIFEFTRRQAHFEVCSERIGAFRLYPESLTGRGVFLTDRSFDRLYEGMTGRTPGPLVRVQRAIGPLVKNLRQPSLAFSRLRDQFVPGLLYHRWLADLNGLDSSRSGG
jgi:glycosyltransferase involved in cell wall biosynthesis